MNIKKEIAKNIGFNLEENELNFEDLIIESISADKGDYCLPCFAFAKVLKSNPNLIAQQIAGSVNTIGIISRCEVVGGYVNFFLNKEKVAKEILTNFNVNNLSLIKEQAKLFV